MSQAIYEIINGVTPFSLLERTRWNSYIIHFFQFIETPPAVLTLDYCVATYFKFPKQSLLFITTINSFFFLKKKKKNSLAKEERERENGIQVFETLPKSTKWQHIHSKFDWDCRPYIANNHATRPSLSRCQLSVTDKNAYFESDQIKIITKIVSNLAHKQWYYCSDT